MKCPALINEHYFELMPCMSRNIPSCSQNIAAISGKQNVVHILWNVYYPTMLVLADWLDRGPLALIPNANIALAILGNDYVN